MVNFDVPCIFAGCQVAPLSIDIQSPQLCPATGNVMVIISPSAGVNPVLNDHLAGKYLGETPEPLSSAGDPVPVNTLLMIVDFILGEFKNPVDGVYNNFAFLYVPFVSVVSLALLLNNILLALASVFAKLVCVTALLVSESVTPVVEPSEPVNIIVDPDFDNVYVVFSGIAQLASCLKYLLVVVSLGNWGAKPFAVLLTTPYVVLVADIVTVPLLLLIDTLLPCLRFNAVVLSPRTSVSFTCIGLWVSESVTVVLAPSEPVNFIVDPDLLNAYVVLASVTLVLEPLEPVSLIVLPDLDNVYVVSTSSIVTIELLPSEPDNLIPLSTLLIAYVVSGGTCQLPSCLKYLVVVVSLGNWGARPAAVLLTTVYVVSLPGIPKAVISDLVTAVIPAIWPSFVIPIL